MNRRKQELEDAALVELTLSGDRDAFDQLVLRYRNQVFRLAYTKTQRPHEAEDLAQDAFVLAYRSLGQLRDHSRFAPWLRRTAENVCNMWLRSQHVEIVPLDEDTHMTSQSVDEAVQKRAEMSRVYDALSNLSETNRLTSVLYFIDGFSMREIAEFLDVPLGTVKRRINLSRTQLKKEMLDMAKNTLGAQKPAADFTGKVAIKIDVMRWYMRLSEYIDAGVSLVRSLHLLAHGDYPETIRQETLAVQHAIEQGSSLSDAVAAHAPTLNHPLTLGLVRSGEVGGVLEQGLKTIVAWMEREDMNRKIDVAYWLRTFAFMLSSGVPLLTALETMKSVVPSDPLQTVPDAAISAIRRGKALSEALQGFPDVFSPAVIALVRAGEYQGSLGVAATLAAMQIMREANELMQSDPYLVSISEYEGGLVNELRRQLASESARVRAGALEALEQMTGTASASEYVNALSDADASVRLTAARILGKHPVPESTDALVAVVKDASSQVRRAALDALLLADPQVAFKIAEEALDDLDVDVRRAAIRVLRSLKRPESAVLLARTLADKDMLAAFPAMEGLVELGDAALPVLLDTTLPDMLERARKGDPDGYALAFGLEAVSKINPGTARELALELLQENVRLLRWLAARTLESLAKPEDWQVLVDLLKESSTAPHAAAALARLKAVDAVPALMEALNYEYDADWVRQRIIWAVDAIKSA